MPGRLGNYWDGLGGNRGRRWLWLGGREGIRKSSHAFSVSRSSSSGSPAASPAGQGSYHPRWFSASMVNVLHSASDCHSATNVPSSVSYPMKGCGRSGFQWSSSTCFNHSAWLVRCGRRCCWVGSTRTSWSMRSAAGVSGTKNLPLGCWATGISPVVDVIFRGLPDGWRLALRSLYFGGTRS